MARNPKRKKEPPSYNKDMLKFAVEEVKSGRVSLKRASKMYSIPRTTLRDRINGRRGVKSAGGGRPFALSQEDELRLANSLKIMDKWGFGLSRKEVMELVQDFVTKNKIKTPFKNNKPGPDWFISFSKRHKLSIKKTAKRGNRKKKSYGPVHC